VDDGAGNQGGGGGLASGGGSQFGASLRLAGGVDARHWRGLAYARGLAPVEVLDAVRFSGSGRSLNLTALRPQGNAFEPCIGALAQLIAADTGSFVPLQVSHQTLAAVPGRPLAYRLSSLVLRKSGEDWSVAKDAAWQTAYVERKFAEGIAAQAAAWNIRAPALACKVVQLGEVLAVRGAVRSARSGSGAATVLILRDADLFVPARLSGHWSIGPLQAAGMGGLTQRPMQGLVIDRELQEALLA
jgi:hypothetical protein